MLFWELNYNNEYKGKHYIRLTNYDNALVCTIIISGFGTIYNFIYCHVDNYKLHV